MNCSSVVGFDVWSLHVSCPSERYWLPPGLSLEAVVAVSCSSGDICTALAERLLSHNLQCGVRGLIRDISEVTGNQRGLRAGHCCWCRCRSDLAVGPALGSFGTVYLRGLVAFQSVPGWSQRCRCVSSRFFCTVCANLDFRACVRCNEKIIL